MQILFLTKSIEIIFSKFQSNCTVYKKLYFYVLSFGFTNFLFYYNIHNLIYYFLTSCNFKISIYSILIKFYISINF